MKNAVRPRVGCPDNECNRSGRHDAGNVVLHGESKVKGGGLRRYHCATCGNTFGARTGTPYRRHRHTMRRFNLVAPWAPRG